VVYHGLEETHTLAVCYKEPPSAKEVHALADIQSNNAPSAYILGNVAFKHKKCLDNLVEPSWLVDTFTRHLSVDGWPPSDGARGQLFGAGSSNKREREENWLELRISKSQRFSDIYSYFSSE
jgi:hypothetical protein